MGELARLPNISKVIEGKLMEVGISTAQELCELGSCEAFLRLRVKDPTACLSMLRALEGAVRGVRWHHLPDEVKAELRVFYEGMSADGAKDS